MNRSEAHDWLFTFCTNHGAPAEQVEAVLRDYRRAMTGAEIAKAYRGRQKIMTPRHGKVTNRHEKMTVKLESAPILGGKEGGTLSSSNLDSACENPRSRAIIHGFKPVQTFNQFDYLSEDEAVFFSRAELANLAVDHPAITNIKGAVRAADRWAMNLPDVKPHQRKAKVLAALATQNLKAEPVRAREKREVEREAKKDLLRANGAHHHRGQAVLP